MEKAKKVKAKNTVTRKAICEFKTELFEGIKKTEERGKYNLKTVSRNVKINKKNDS